MAINFLISDCQTLKIKTQQQSCNSEIKTNYFRGSIIKPFKIYDQLLMHFFDIIAKGINYIFRFKCQNTFLSLQTLFCILSISKYYSRHILTIFYTQHVANVKMILKEVPPKEPSKKLQVQENLNNLSTRRSEG
ncbi:hypothetical protein ACKWTF_000373 [Chironomus riparius]